MNHQPFDTWLIEPEELTPEQKGALSQHLQTCSQCRQLSVSLVRLDRILEETPIQLAPIGFTDRFQANLARRRKEEQRRQIRTVILILLGAILTSSGIFLANFLSHYSLTKLIGSLIQFITYAPQRLIEFRFIISFWIVKIPAPVFAITGALIVFWTFLLLTPWVLTLLRIKRQGVTDK